MGRVDPKELAKTEELIEVLQSWTEQEVEELPKFYREKARELRNRLSNPGQDKSL